MENNENKPDVNAVPEPVAVKKVTAKEREYETTPDGAKNASALMGEAERAAMAPPAPFKVETTDLGHGQD